jgi:hypothetical protein
VETRKGWLGYRTGYEFAFELGEDGRKKEHPCTVLLLKPKEIPASMNWIRAGEEDCPKHRAKRSRIQGKIYRQSLLAEITPF